MDDCIELKIENWSMSVVFMNVARVVTLCLGIPLVWAMGSPAHAHSTQAPPPSIDPSLRYDNTFAKDFIMDAPWRVIDENTAIPVTIILKDCDVDDIRELHWIRLWDVTGGGSVLLWDHDFNDEQIGDDASEANYWTYITTVTEGHATLLDGSLLTPVNLGYTAGDDIQMKVSVYYRDDWFNYTENRNLRVQVGNGPFPWPENWYGGDTHYHTMYTNNLYEFGAPLPAVHMTAIAMGLDWLTTTDHSCDLDETGDGTYSYATQQWEYSIQTPAGIATTYRDNTSYSSSWGAMGADVSDLDSPAFRLFRGVEINLASIDADSWEKTLHTLFYNPDYIHSPYSGALGERPVFPSLPGGLDSLAVNGFAYAAHPLSDLSAEWAGLDWGVNGSIWGDQDLDSALVRESFRGIQAFNTRETRYSSDQNNPWDDFDAGDLPDNPYPNELLAGVELWDQLLCADLATGASRKVFLSGGSDAHGDFNYASYMSVDNYATDNAMGRVQTVAYVPGEYGNGNLPPMNVILNALRAGHTVVTDGPFLEIGLDLDGDGDWYESGDLKIGDHGTVNAGSELPLHIRWASLEEFGPVDSVWLIVGDQSGTFAAHALSPNSSGSGYGGSTVIDVSSPGLAGAYYFRAELLTDDGDIGHRAYTNPIWMTLVYPPAPIDDLAAAAMDDAIRLRWSAITLDEIGQPTTVDQYVVYRDTDPYFISESADSIGVTTDLWFDDTDASVGDPTTNHYYVVKAVDSLGHRSSDSNRVGEFERSVSGLLDLSLD